MPNPVYYKKDPNLADLKTNSDTLVTDSATIKADVATTKGSAGTIATNTGTTATNTGTTAGHASTIATNTGTTATKTTALVAAQVAATDTVSSAVIEIDYNHARIHAGKAFYYHDVAQLVHPGTPTLYYVLYAPASGRIHFGFEIDYINGAATTKLYEGTNGTGTTAQSFPTTVICNRDRNSATAATLGVYKGYTAAGGGPTLGDLIFWKSAGTGKTSGGEAGTAQERILKANTKYVLELTNTSGANNTFTLVLRWYEVTL
jgi:hypothetical protein